MKKIVSFISALTMVLSLYSATAMTGIAADTTAVNSAYEAVGDNSAALAELDRKGKILFDEFKREKAVLLGELDANASRLTLEEVESYIEGSEMYTIIYEGLEYHIIDDTQIELTGVADKTTRKIHIPTEIDGRKVNVEPTAFSGCSELTEITVDSENPYYSSVEGVLFNKDESQLIAYPTGLSGEYTIPEGTRSIGFNAFQNAVDLTYIGIPDSLENIGRFAFSGCESLTGFSSDIPLIYGDSLENCTSLKDLVLKESKETKTITNLKLIGCNDLKKIVVPNNYVLNDSFIVENCPNLSEVLLSCSCDLKKLKIINCDSLTNFKIPHSPDKISYVINISDCDKLEEIDLTTNDFIEVSLNKLDSLENLIMGSSQGIEYKISGCGKLGSLTCYMKLDNEIDYSTCQNLKDLYFYEENSQHCYIADIDKIVENNVTVHCQKSNTSLQKYLAENSVKYSLIDDEIIYGDANKDRIVNISDAVMVMQACLNPKKYGVDGTSSDHITSEGEKAGDVDGIEGLTANDALVIQRFSLGLIDKLPVK